MGIRYYGWAVTTDETARAANEPWSVISEVDQRCGGTGWAFVDLDKAWCLLQGLFRPKWNGEPRAGYELVAGNVTYPEGYAAGYEPHVGVLRPEQVRLIAKDVASVDEADLQLYCAGLCYDDETVRRDDQDYLTFHLKAAQAFTADVAARGYGIVYTIC